MHLMVLGVPCPQFMPGTWAAHGLVLMHLVVLGAP